ncbi:SAM-dependent methyltransferase [uncultured Serinicoccus sp.]|uniref:SAM-dependent methyltransferase n=1 Tax=uncultured Serinicoccus sp. TaxID=735514 RepID=UPI002624C7A2|nr:SAM-dependent methyltransferase [uncultured Serinicoccus sp.]
MSAPAPPHGTTGWEPAWQQALYGPGGFYRASAPSAHFATSAQGIPGGGELLAAAVVALARRHGCRRVVDLGCGRGELLTQLRRLDPSLHLTGVDVVARPTGLDVDAWLVSPGGAALPDELRDLPQTLVLAHEWLDVVPCPVVARDATGVWRSLAVAPDGTEHLGPVLRGDDLAWVRRWLDDDDGSDRRGEVGRPREAALADLVGRVRSGLVVMVDYGHTAEDRPPHGTLTGFRGGREVPPVPDGSCDLTAHVAVDALLAHLRIGRAGGEPDTGRAGGRPRLARQRDLLRDLLGDPGTKVPHALSRTDPPAYLAGLARRAALTTLTGAALGDFWWLLVPVGPAPGDASAPGIG